MARLVTDGAESGDLLRLAVAIGTVSASKGRPGSYSYRTGNGSSAATFKYLLPAAETELYIRFAVYVDSLQTAHKIITWTNSAGTEIGSLRMDQLGPLTLQVYDSTTPRVTSSNLNWQNSQGHVIEVRVKIDGAGVGKFEVKFDGTSVANFTGITNTAGADILNIWLYGIAPGTGGYAYYDDIAINNTAGAVDNSWVGDGGVLAALVPITGAAEYADLIASEGDACDCVNEIPANATDYVYESTVNKKSTYLMSDLAGLPSGASIARVWMEIVALETAADGDKIATLLRSATTDVQGADQALTLAYVRFVADELLTDPAGGEDPTWTEAKVNALQVGAVVR